MISFKNLLCVHDACLCMRTWANTHHGLFVEVRGGSQALVHFSPILGTSSSIAHPWVCQRYLAHELHGILPSLPPILLQGHEGYGCILPCRALPMSQESDSGPHTCKANVLPESHVSSPSFSVPISLSLQMSRWTLIITTGKETWLRLAQAGWNPTHPERQQLLLHGSTSREQLLTHQRGQRDSVSLSVDNGLHCLAEYLNLQLVIIGHQLKGLASEFSLLDLHMEMGVMYSTTFLPALQLHDFFL